MTENEAIKELQDNIDSPFGRYVPIEVCEVAIKSLEEIQQYRAIGTVEGYEKAIQATTEYYLLMKEYKSKVQDFEAIGTIEEVKALKYINRIADNLSKMERIEYKALKEKSVIIANGKWIDTEPEYSNGYYKNAHVCSNCFDYYTTEYDEMKFCPKCGAKMTKD